MHLLVHLKAKEREREKGGDKEGKRGEVREGERMREDESELAALLLTTSVASNCGRTIGVVSEPLQHRWRILHTAYVRVHAYVRAQGEYPHTSAVCRILDLTCIQDTHTCPPAVYVSVYGYIMYPCVARAGAECGSTNTARARACALLHPWKCCCPTVSRACVGHQ